MVQDADVLVGSLERESLRATGWEESDPQLGQRLDESLRLGILFSASRALVPGAGYFETDCGYKAFRAFMPSQERGQLALTASGAGPFDYIGGKLDHWRGNTALLRRYERDGPLRASILDSAAWRTKQEVTDWRLFEEWQRSLDEGKHPLLPALRRDGYSQSRAERMISSVPHHLEGTVMLVDNIASLLVAGRSHVNLNYRDRHGLRVQLSQGYFRSYLDDSSAIALIDRRLGVQEAFFPSGARRVDDKALGGLLQALGMKEMLLQRISHKAFAEVVESYVWRCLRPELMRRCLEDQPFDRGELKALHKARESDKAKDKQKAVIESLERQHEALERGRERRGTRNASGAAWEGGMGEAMAAYQWLRNAEVFRFGGRSPRMGPQRLGAMLQGVLEARTVGEALLLIEELDRVLEQDTELEMSNARAVAEIVTEREDLREKARRLPEGVRTALINFATETSSSVAGQGLWLALKTLGL